MGKNVRPCEHRYPLGDPRGARCWRNTSDPSGYCHQHREGLATRRAALAAARDEVIAAARQVSALLEMMRDDDLARPASGNSYGLTPSGGRLLKIHHDALIAALDKLEGK